MKLISKLQVKGSLVVMEFDKFPGDLILVTVRHNHKVASVKYIEGRYFTDYINKLLHSGNYTLNL